MDENETGIVRPEALSDDEPDRALRPRLLADFQGQEPIKQNLAVFIEAARARGESMDHRSRKLLQRCLVSISW